jgi:hypothetical protein
MRRNLLPGPFVDIENRHGLSTLLSWGSVFGPRSVGRRSFTDTWRARSVTVLLPSCEPHDQSGDPYAPQRASPISLPWTHSVRWWAVPRCGGRRWGGRGGPVVIWGSRATSQVSQPCGGSVASGHGASAKTRWRTTATVATLPEAVRENEEVVSVDVSTWVLLSGVTVGR